MDFPFLVIYYLYMYFINLSANPAPCVVLFFPLFYLSFFTLNLQNITEIGIMEKNEMLCVYNVFVKKETMGKITRLKAVAD